MKKEVEDVLGWLNELVGKYGFWLMIVFAIWLGVKKAWFWFFMPVLFFMFLNQLCLVFSWGFLAQIDIKLLIASWVFVFSLLRVIGEKLFVKVQD